MALVHQENNKKPQKDTEYIIFWLVGRVTPQATQAWCMAIVGTAIRIFPKLDQNMWVSLTYFRREPLFPRDEWQKTFKIFQWESNYKQVSTG